MSQNSGDKDIKLEYFKEYWKDFTGYTENRASISYFKNLEQDSINPILYNPKELFKEFIDEIERKNLSNPDSKKFFIENTNNLNTLELNALEFLKPTLKIIQQQFNEKDFSYLHHVLKFALEEMNDFRLGKECVKELSKILFNDESLENNKEYIKHLVRFIVFELQDKGFSAKTTSEIVNNIAEPYFTLQDMIATKFPHNLEFTENPTQENNKKYYQDLKAYMDSLTNKDRIEAINNYFSKKAFPAKFIFRVNGIKGKENLTIGGYRNL